MFKIALFAAGAVLCASQAFADPVTINWNVRYMKAGSPDAYVKTQIPVPIPDVGHEIDINIDDVHWSGIVNGVKQTISHTKSDTADQYNYDIEITAK